MPALLAFPFDSQREQRVQKHPRPFGRSLLAIAAATVALSLHTRTAHADMLDDALSILSTAGVVDPAIVEANQMIQCLINGKPVEVCAELAAGLSPCSVPGEGRRERRASRA